MSACRHSHLHNHTDGSPANAHLHFHATAHCELPNWDDFKLHWGLGLGLWCILTILGLMLGNCRHSWESDRVENRLRRYVMMFTVSRWYLLPAASIAFVLCLLRVVRSEFGDDFGNIGTLWDDIEVYSTFIHVLEMFILWLYAVAKSNRDFMGLAFGKLLVDCLLAPSMLLFGFYESQASAFSLSQFAAMRLLGLWRTFSESRGPQKQDVRMQMLDDSLALICGIYCMAACIKQVETLEGWAWPVYLDDQGKWADTDDIWATWTLSQSMYFVMTTISTVGYGDLKPRNFVSQCLAALVLIVGVILLLRILIGVGEALEIARGGGGGYEKHRGHKHVVVVGTPSFEVLCDFVQELFHEDHAHESEDLNCVILLPRDMRPVVDAFKKYLKTPSNRRLGHKVWIIQGSALKHKDLDRVLCKDASMAFILPNLHARDPEREDVANGMRALSLRRHAPYVRIVTLILKEELRPMMLSPGLVTGDIISADMLGHGLLGKSCEVQGFATLVGILLKNASLPEEISAKDKPIWMDDYCEGLANELYEVELATPYWGAPYAEVAVDILMRSAQCAYLVGVVEEPTYPGDEMVTRLFPGRDYRVGLVKERRHKGVFVATDRSAIRQIEPGMPFKWHLGSSETGRNLIDFAGEDAQAGKFVSSTKEQDVGDPMDASKEAELMAKEAGLAAPLPGIHRPPRPETDAALAATGRQGWVRAARDIAAEHSAKILYKMHGRATRHTADGLRKGANLSRAEADAIVGVPSRTDHGELTAEEHASLMTDLAAEDAEEEMLRQQQEMASAHARELGAALQLVRLAEQKEQEHRAPLEPSWQEVEEDNQLWGCPPAKALQIWGKPQEPSIAMLVRGGHIVVLAIETESFDSSDTATLRKAKERMATTSDNATQPGRKLGLKHMLSSLRSNSRKGSFAYAHELRPVIVMADRVPADWPQIMAAEKEVYLVVGPPLSIGSAQRAGLVEAHAVVIHQRGPMTADSPDAEAVFATHFVEQQMAAAGREVPIVVGLNFTESAFYVPLNIDMTTAADHKPKAGSSEKDIKEKQKEKDEDDEIDVQKKIDMEGKNLPFFLQPRYICGQLTVSSAPTFLLANMMYNPSLGSIIQGLVAAASVLVPIPDDTPIKTYGKLFEVLVRRKNLLPMGLLRRLDHDETEFEEDDDGGQTSPKAGAVAAPTTVPQDGVAAPPTIVTAMGKPSSDGTFGVLEISAGANDKLNKGAPRDPTNPHILHGRWTTGDKPSDRYVFVMPPGDRRVSPIDAVLCIKPTVEPPRRPPEALPMVARSTGKKDQAGAPGRGGRSGSKVSTAPESRAGSKLSMATGA